MGDNQGYSQVGQQTDKVLHSSSYQKAETTQSRLMYLDTLRGFAALWVVFFHMIYLSDPVLDVPEKLFFMRIGGMGVPLFFIISAFSLCLTMPRHVATGRTLLSFHVHRIFRVVPLFYFVLALSLYFFASKGAYYPLERIFLNISCLFNFFPGEQLSLVMAGWTVGVEILFYIIFPSIYIFGKNIINCLILFFVSICVAIMSQIFIDDNEYYAWSILRHAPIFIGGMLLFQLHEKIKYISGWGRSTLGILMCLGFFPAFMFLIRYGNTPYIGYYLHLLPFSLALLGFSLFTPPLLVSSFTASLGKVSYSLYLLHPLVIVNINHIYPKIYALGFGVTFSFILCSLVTFMFLVPLAYLSFCYIEKPGIKLGKMILRNVLPPQQIRG